MGFGVTLFNTGLAFVVSAVENILCPARLCEAKEELRCTLNAAEKIVGPQPKGMSRADYKEMIKNNDIIKNAFERFRKEENTPNSSFENRLAFSTAGHAALCSGLATASGCIIGYFVKRIADSYQLDRDKSKIISMFAGAIFTGFAIFYLTKSYPVSTFNFASFILTQRG